MGIYQTTTHRSLILQKMLLVLGLISHHQFEGIEPSVDLVLIQTGLFLRTWEKPLPRIIFQIPLSHPLQVKVAVIAVVGLVQVVAREGTQVMAETKDLER